MGRTASAPRRGRRDLASGRGRRPGCCRSWRRAGGGLTLALIRRLTELGEELPACAWVVSPWTDLTMSGATLATKDGVDPIIHKGYLDELANAYLPPGMGRTDPRVSPLYGDLKG